MTEYHCDDGDAEAVYTDETPEGAAAQYVEDGDWGTDSSTRTHWVRVRVWTEDEEGEETGDSEWYTIPIDPEEPECGHDGGHDWASPHSMVGGLKENPGVWGKGGGVLIQEVCRHCGRYRDTDTWAQDPETGEQGLTSVSYSDPDAASLEWVEVNSNEPDDDTTDGEG